MRTTLITDGSSDRVLVPILRWLLGQHATTPFELLWADLARLRSPPRGLTERISVAVDLYPCDILLVHRDAERASRQQRVEEIDRALAQSGFTLPLIHVIPVRMQEAWLLFAPEALRQAAGKPTGREPLNLPAPNQVESQVNPKKLLHAELRRASGRKGRRAKQFRPEVSVHRMVDLIDDFRPLRELPAFRALENEVCAVLKQFEARNGVL